MPLEERINTLRNLPKGKRTKKYNKEKLRQKAKEFFIQYFKIDEDELQEDCYKIIDLMTKFAESILK